MLYTGPMFQVSRAARFSFAASRPCCDAALCSASPARSAASPAQVYNLILRRFPLREYEAYRDGGNCFATTIAVLASAVAKMARVTKLPPGLELFRGLGGLVDLPEEFWRSDENGCRGYTEYGFMSTTSNKATALEYSGAKEKRPNPTARPPLLPRPSYPRPSTPWPPCLRPIAFKSTGAQRNS